MRVPATPARLRRAGPAHRLRAGLSRAKDPRRECVLPAEPVLCAKRQDRRGSEADAFASGLASFAFRFGSRRSERSCAIAGPVQDDAADAARFEMLFAEVDHEAEGHVEQLHVGKELHAETV